MSATTEEIGRVLETFGFNIPKGAKITGIRLDFEYNVADRAQPQGLTDRATKTWPPDHPAVWGDLRDFDPDGPDIGVIIS